ALVRWSGFRPTPRGGAVLSALLRQAGDPLAARTLLQALLPRLRCENVYTATFGHRLPEHSQEPSDTAADLVTECYAAIVRHAGEDRSDVDRLLVREAARRLRTARQGVHRYRSRTLVLSGEAMVPTTGLFTSARSGPEWLATAVVEAARKGQIDLVDARLVYEARVKGVPASEIGRRHGYGPGKVYPALARAERVFLEKVA
ncbi:MAG TPA: hypothetical protein VFN61_14330, partial [Acidimicrobiales bacterium]|nr:hypothetical protein [Acidimicrobiales bacterium]